jgi:hypothetical protein
LLIALRTPLKNEPDTFECYSGYMGGYMGSAVLAVKHGFAVSSG